MTCHAENNLIPVSGQWMSSSLFYFFHCYVVEIKSRVRTEQYVLPYILNATQLFHSSLVQEKAKFTFRCSILLTLGNWAAIIEPCTWRLSSLKSRIDYHECATSTEIESVNQQKKSKRFGFQTFSATPCLVSSTVPFYEVLSTIQPSRKQM